MSCLVDNTGEDSTGTGGSGAAAPGPSTEWGTLAVLGLGQLGGSIALAARAAGMVEGVVGFGRSQESLDRAILLGVANRTTTDPAEAVAEASTVVLSVPLRAIASVVERVRPALREGALVIDVGSVKRTAVRDIEAHLPAAVSFVACHPIAGSERSGPEAASRDLFRGRACVLCPSERTTAAALDRARRFWMGIGAHVLVMPAPVHDVTMAAVSHLPHVAAFALASALKALPAEIVPWAAALPTNSLRDTTRIAASSAVMWRDVFLENEAALLPMIDRLQEALTELRGAISSSDAPRVEQFLRSAREARSKLIRD